MTQTLSIKQARKLILLSQGLPPRKQQGTALNASLAAIERLGYVQIDTISVVQRAHHHTLWNRAPRYQPSHIDQLLKNEKVFEYWSHAAAYLPMSDFKYSLPRKQAFKSGKQKHWYKADKRRMRSVMKRIENEGPLMAKDFDNSSKKNDAWQSKPNKQALECLFMQGDLMVGERRNFHKVYDLTERVFPNSVNIELPTPEEHSKFLIRRYLQSNGIGTAREICYLLKDTKPSVQLALQKMIETGELENVTVLNNEFYVASGDLERLNQSLSRNKALILSPFDNLLIQRQRVQQLFNFDYLIECYTPAAKRQYGYFCLPILWRGELVARMDCKVDRKKLTLHILQLFVEPSLTDREAFELALGSALATFMTFNRCDSLAIEKHIRRRFEFNL